MRNAIVRLANIYVAGLPDHRALQKGPAIETMSGLQSNQDAGQSWLSNRKLHGSNRWRTSLERLQARSCWWPDSN